MQLSQTNIADFLSFVPDADTAEAALFLQRAGSVSEAVDQYYENPQRYSSRALSGISTSMSVSVSHRAQSATGNHPLPIALSPTYPPSYSLAMRSPPASTASQTSPRQSIATMSSESSHRPHTNALIEASKVRARDEPEMQKMLHSAQLSGRVFNPEVEPEHETTDLCDCPVHTYWKRKIERLDTHETWSKAVVYPGEKPYHEFTHLRFFNNNPYSDVMSSYAPNGSALYGIPRPDPQFHARFVEQTIALNTSLNIKAQAAVQAMEPSFNVWELEQLESLVSNMSHSRRLSTEGDGNVERPSTRSSIRKVLSVKTSDERTAVKIKKKFAGSFELRAEIMKEENGRWQYDTDRQIVAAYQEKVGIAQQVAEFRTHKPRQYIHLLRAGYFEPIPVAWQGQACSPLGFTIDSAAGWRGITPAWRGYTNNAEERLYWVLNHRAGGGDMVKPTLLRGFEIASARMASAEEPNPRYHTPDDICHENQSRAYTKQVKAPFILGYTPKKPADETIIMLDASGSMDHVPVRPDFDKYLVTGFSKSNQPKNKDIARVIVRRFIEALGKYENNGHGYKLTTFSTDAEYIDVIHSWTLNEAWREIKFKGRARVMAGWHKIKELHFQKYSATATYHPVHGWQAGPETPTVRLLLILDGEASDMDEFELELLGVSWAYITIFLIGVDGCLHHHRHASRLQRMCDHNPRVSFVDAQGNIPERMVTHELLKRHLGRDLTISQFEELEQTSVELPSPLQPQHQRNRSSQTTLEYLPVELPSPEETTLWQREQLSPQRRGLFELPAQQAPVELPTFEDSVTVARRSTQRPPIPQPPAPLRQPPVPPPLQYGPLDPPPPYLETA
ncbi:uncharacterized protein N7443_002855 [Penicillium atrosanguineum]|uniref:uncharacterized protein n=1 Tax=Penicillium atrosanguineum TaxID=1132637 RepID=UPI002394D575|nr:uncharacterized protein N7443_002855 [Penicillium atrosanguineum]KAJ5310394.1 hypothetical protein N7443_002855 [Penicillium atrosanguineum]